MQFAAVSTRQHADIDLLHQVPDAVDIGMFHGSVLAKGGVLAKNPQEQRP
jgi:hypothetical protein